MSFNENAGHCISEGKYSGFLKLPFDHVQALSRLTMAELHDIRSELDIKGGSNLPKSRLAYYIAQAFPEKAEQFFEWFDETLYETMKKADPETGIVDGVPCSPEYLDYLCSYGMLFTGRTVDDKRVTVVPPALLERFAGVDGPDYRAGVARNTEWGRIIVGLLRYHGALTFKEMYELFGAAINDKVHDACILRFISHISRYNTLISVFSDGIAYRYADNPEQVLAERKARADLSNYPFTREQLLKAGKGEMKRNEVVLFPGMLRYLKRMGMKDNDAVMFTAAVRISWQNKIPPFEMIGEVYNILQRSPKSQQEIDGLVQAMQGLIDNTRMWILKGHTALEAAAITQ
ncbi:MAG: hypothetical protein PHT33_15730 [bacterium]|nr:hypothetical protein [bacterium]